MPWRRFLARSFDNALFFLIITYVLGFSLDVDQLFRLPLLYAVYMPLEILQLLIFKTTVGKYLLGLMVYVVNGERMPIKVIIYRTIYVYAIGLGAGIVLLMPIAMGLSYARLKENELTIWDKRLGTRVKSWDKPVG
ncbi:MAG: RDD family protein [Candidatus Thiodiazotropha sp. L084R]